MPTKCRLAYVGCFNQYVRACVEPSGLDFLRMSPSGNQLTTTLQYDVEQIKHEHNQLSLIDGNYCNKYNSYINHNIDNDVNGSDNENENNCNNDVLTM